MSQREANQDGPYLRSLRENAGMTQTDLARKTGIRQSVISDLENNKVPFSWHYAEVLAPAFGTTVTALARATSLLPPGFLTEQEERLTELQEVAPDLLAFVARLRELSPEARFRFNAIVRAMLDAEEEAQQGRLASGQ